MSIINYITLISLVGVLFSGYMTIKELKQKFCPAEGCQKILGLPSCFYGLLMYLIILILSLLV